MAKHMLKKMMLVQVLSRLIGQKMQLHLWGRFKKTASKLCFCVHASFFFTTVVKEQSGKLQAGICLIDLRAQELSELFQGPLRLPPPRIVDSICLKVQLHQDVQLIEKISGGHHILGLKNLSLREIHRMTVGDYKAQLMMWDFDLWHATWLNFDDFTNYSSLPEWPVCKWVRNCCATVSESISS
jgi:hypothetical protein